MNLLLFLLGVATAINGLLAGLNVDTALVKFPTRWRIGMVAYATFARVNDLGNGEETLQGTPASAGSVTGIARVIHDPHGAHLSAGEILVVPSTDPG